MNSNLPPVFIHSLFRSGSTYIFNVFRQSKAGYWCYQEPENEYLININDAADKLLENMEGTVIALRHPNIKKPYYWEYYQIKDDLKGLFKKPFSYDLFFVDSREGFNDDQEQYFGALIRYAKGRPVLQFCRSAGRVAAFKKTFGGVHIHLWRDPRNQWWSFKVNNYFDAIVQRIYNADVLPAVLDEARIHCGIAVHHEDDVQKEIEHAQKHPLISNHNYYAFYSLWLYAFLECEKHADLTINIDQLSANSAYRNAVLQRLLELDIDGIDFSDCSIPRTSFSNDEIKSYSSVEMQVQDRFKVNGYGSHELERVDEECDKVFRLNKKGYRGNLRDVIRARAVSLRLMDQYALAEVRAAQAEGRAIEAKRHADHAKERMAQAEGRVAQAEGRVAQAEGRVAQAEGRAIEAKRHADHVEERVAQFHEHAEKMTASFMQSEERLSLANTKLEVLNDKLTAVTAKLDVWKNHPIKSVISHYIALVRKA